MHSKNTRSWKIEVRENSGMREQDVSSGKAAPFSNGLTC
jgi:hypothetical protein